MKFLFDLFPVLLFVLAFKFGEANKTAAAEHATRWFGGLVSGGIVGAEQAPILWATLIAIAATLLQVGYRLLRRQKVEPALWLSLAVITVFGGATIWFHDDNFIKWKPTVIYWLISATLAIGYWAFGKNWIRSLMPKDITLPEFIWRRLLIGWVVFFLAMGVVNLYVAYTFTLNTWVSFKLFGLMGFTLTFGIVQALMISKYLVVKEASANDRTPS